MVPDHEVPNLTYMGAFKDPRQQALSEVIPTVCEIYGVDPRELGCGRRQSASEAELVAGELRTLVVGNLIWIGKSLGLVWCELQGASPLDPGHCEIPELLYLHRYTARRAYRRYEAFCKRGGLISRVVRDRVAFIAEAAARRTVDLGGQCVVTRKPGRPLKPLIPRQKDWEAESMAEDQEENSSLEMETGSDGGELVGT